MNSPESGLRASGIGLAVNILLAIAKVTTGLLGNSYALIADGLESTADIVSSLIVLGSLRISARPADDDHPFGHGKAESIAGVFIALALIVAACAIAFHSVQEIRTPHHAPAPFTLVVLVVVIALKELIFRKVLDVGENLDSTALKGEAWHHRSDAITSAAAFIGISIALLGGPGYESADDWAALAACGVIASNGVMLLRPALDELMDRVPDRSLVDRVRDAAASVPGVSGIGRCRLRKSGMGLLVDLHLKLPGTLTVIEGHRLAHAVEDLLREQFPRIVYVSIHIEPDRESHALTSATPADDAPLPPHSPGC